MVIVPATMVQAQLRFNPHAARTKTGGMAIATDRYHLAVCRFTVQVASVRIVPSCTTQSAPTNTKSHVNVRRADSPARFSKPAISASAPTLIANDPSESSVCGGLKIFTSRPYALCHQLSKGAEVSIAIQTHVAMNAPSGPRNPQIFTETLCAVASPPNVVVRIMYAQAMPTSTPFI